MTIKVLLTCVGGGLTPQVIRFLKNSKVHKNTKVYLEPSNTASYCEDLDKNSEKLLEKRFKENNQTC